MPSTSTQRNSNNTTAQRGNNMIKALKDIWNAPLRTKLCLLFPLLTVFIAFVATGAYGLFQVFPNGQTFNSLSPMVQVCTFCFFLLALIFLVIVPLVGTIAIFGLWAVEDNDEHATRNPLWKRLWMYYRAYFGNWFIGHTDINGYLEYYIDFSKWFA